MRIISTTDLSHEVNGTHVYKSVSLIEEFGIYNILIVEKKVGQMMGNKVYLKADNTCDLDVAKYFYRQEGGIFITIANTATSS